MLFIITYSITLSYAFYEKESSISWPLYNEKKLENRKKSLLVTTGIEATRAPLFTSVKTIVDWNLALPRLWVFMAWVVYRLLRGFLLWSQKISRARSVVLHQRMHLVRTWIGLIRSLTGRLFHPLKFQLKFLLLLPNPFFLQFLSIFLLLLILLRILPAL